jgi:hypothetical protein
MVVTSIFAKIAKTVPPGQQSSHGNADDIPQLQTIGAPAPRHLLSNHCIFRLDTYESTHLRKGYAIQARLLKK